MGQRSRELIGEVRLALHKLSPQDITDTEIYFAAKAAQNKIIARIKFFESSFDLQLQPGVESYDYSDENMTVIKNMFPSWTKGKLEYVDNVKWDEYRQLSGGYPAYFTIFAQELYFSPVPTTADTIKIWGNKVKASYDISDDNDPEIPPILDEALTLATIAEYDDSYIPKWQDEVDLRKPDITRKQSMNNRVNGDW